MFHDNDSQLVVNLDCNFGKKELPFMITKTLFIRFKLSNLTLDWAVCNTI